jgi:hypothetical protein
MRDGRRRRLGDIVSDRTVTPWIRRFQKVKGSVLEEEWCRTADGGGAVRGERTHERRMTDIIL